MKEFDPVTQDSPNDPKNPASMSPVVFESSGCKLLGTMFLASGAELKPIIILLHGFPGNEVNFDLAHVFRRQGFNVMVFHYRGCWGSEGNYSWNNLIEDTEAAINFVKSEFAKKKFKIDPSKIILMGHSMGGFAALYCSIHHDEITNVASISGFNSGAFGEILEINKMIYDYSKETILPAMELVSNTTAEKLLNEYISKKKEWNLLNHMDKLSNKNLLLIGAKYDMIAPMDLHHKPLVEQLESRKSKACLPVGIVESSILETGHSFSDSRIKLSKLISGWLDKIIF